MAADGAMDLAGLLLDEEGTFSLTGFQDFTVRAQSASPPPLEAGSRNSGAFPLDPSGMGDLLLTVPQIGRLL